MTVLKGFDLMAMVVAIMAKNHFFTIEGDDKYLYQHTGREIKRWTRRTLCEHLASQNVDEDIIDIISRDDNIVHIADCLPKVGGNLTGVELEMNAVMDEIYEKELSH